MNKTMFPAVFAAVLLLFQDVAGASPFNHQDQEADDVAFFVSRIAGDKWEKDILRDHPNASITWGGRAFFPPRKEAAQWMIYAELRDEDEEPHYYIFEVMIRPVGDWSKLEEYRQ